MCLMTIRAEEYHNRAPGAGTYCSESPLINRLQEINSIISGPFVVRWPTNVRPNITQWQYTKIFTTINHRMTRRLLNELRATV